MVASDDYSSMSTGLASPFDDGEDITPHDTDELTKVTRGLLAYTTAGKCTVVTSQGTTLVVYLALGSITPVRAKIVKTTGTDAVGITGVY